MLTKSQVLTSAVIATVMAFGAVAYFPWQLVYPDRCGAMPAAIETANVGQFCVAYDPDLGRYEDPPAGVPADVSRPPEFVVDTASVRIVTGISVSLVVLVMTNWIYRRRAGATQ